MRVGDIVHTGVSLSARPAGMLGRVKEMGGLFTAVEFPDGRIGWYTPQQLELVAEVDQGAECTAQASLGLAGGAVPYGSHVCLLATSRAEMMAILAPYLVAGLESDDRCLCACPCAWHSALRAAIDRTGSDADSHRASGRLVVAGPDHLYLDAAEFTADRQLERTTEVVAGLTNGGACRARVFGHPTAAVSAGEQWWEYEARVGNALKATETLALCGYGRFTPRDAHWEHARFLHPYIIEHQVLLTNGPMQA